MIKAAVAGTGTMAGGALPTASAPATNPINGLSVESSDHLETRHRTVAIDGLDIFYREAGRKDAPAILLLHGFPASSHMFRHLIPVLAESYRVVAPDYPAFGYSSFPARETYRYTFQSLAETIARFSSQIGLERFALYIQDYGAPVGLRLALMRPNSITALITQNGNAYEEGLSPLWDPLKAYWGDPSPENRAVLQGWLGADGTRLQYAAGVREDQLERLAPDTWVLDWEKLGRPGNADVQIDLFGDYQSNVELYPEFQRYFRQHRPPTLVLWGKNDPFFTVAGARAFRRDLPDAEIDLVDASHFVLETHGQYAAHRIRRFLARAVA